MKNKQESTMNMRFMNKKQSTFKPSIQLLTFIHYILSIVIASTSVSVIGPFLFGKGDSIFWLIITLGGIFGLPLLILQLVFNLIIFDIFDSSANILKCWKAVIAVSVLSVTLELSWLGLLGPIYKNTPIGSDDFMGISLISGTFISGILLYYYIKRRVASVEHES